MNRISLQDDFALDHLIRGVDSEGDEPRIEWATALLVAHVETEQGPDLRILRVNLDNGAAHRVGAGPEEAGSESMVFVDGNDLVLSIGATSQQEGDASLVIGFELSAPTRITARNLDDDPAPTIVVRNYAVGRIHVLNGDDESVDLAPGTWAIQVAAVPDGITRSGLLRFGKPGEIDQEHRRSA